MEQFERYLPRTSDLDPRLTVLPTISAPVDQGLLIPYPPRSRWLTVFWSLVLIGAAGVALGYAFLRANAFQ